MTRSLSLPASRLALACAAALSLASLAAPARAADAAAGRAYVSNQSGDVSIIDLATMEVSGEYSAYGKEPRGIGLTADGKWLITANRDDGGISVIDRSTGALVRKIHIGANPEFVRTRGHLAFVSFEPSSTGKPPAAGGPPGTASGPGSAPEAASAPAEPTAASGAGKPHDDDKSDAPARIAIVDLDKGKVIRQVVGGMQTEGIEFSADGKHILVTNEEDENVTIHRISDGRLVKKIDTKPYGDRPRGIKMAPDGKSYVATLEQSNMLLVIDAKYNVVKSVPTGLFPYGVAFDRKGEKLYVALGRGKALEVFDTRTYESIKRVPTGDRCWHFSFTPDDSQIMVACGRSNEVVVIDVATLEPVKRIADKKLPWGIVTYPKSVGSLDRPE